MSRIGVLITDWFQDVEYKQPAEKFMQAGHTLVHIGLEAGTVVKGENGKETVRIDKSVRDVSVNEFDALFIPGGYSPDRLRGDEAVVRFVKEFMGSGKPIFAICHAPQLLITADVLRGRKVTGWKSIVQDIKNAGAKYVDAEVVVDGNLVSSRKPEDIPAFVRESLAMLGSGKPSGQRTGATAVH